MKDQSLRNTALSDAMWRALHQLVDRPVIVDDPLALRIIGEERVDVLSEAILRAEHQLVDRPKIFNDSIIFSIIGKEPPIGTYIGNESFSNLPSSADVRAFVITRNLYIEEQLADAVEQGVCQYVILKAGLDTFAYRNPYPKGKLRIFEVDHPATQAWKVKCLLAKNISISDDLKFVPVDFDQQLFTEELQEAVFDRRLPTFFALYSCSRRFSYECFVKILDFISYCSIGSGVVFDYSHPFIEESKTITLTPLGTLEMLRRFGFNHVEYLKPEDINAKYLNNHTNNDFRVREPNNLIRAYLSETVYICFRS